MELNSKEVSSNFTDGEQQLAPYSQAGRPPPIFLTSETNLSWLQNKLKSIVKANFGFQNTRDGTRAVTKVMSNFSAIKSYLHLEKSYLLYLLS
jgi:hypothetical protein